MGDVKVTINGQEIVVAAGTRILEAAKSADIYIPTLCYHPDLPPAKGAAAAKVIYQGEREIENAMPDEAGSEIPIIGFIAHVDTSPAITGENVKPVVHKNYQGGDIVLPGDKSRVISPKEYPNLEKLYIGMDIVTSDGTTLLGADDKAGVAEIMTAVASSTNVTPTPMATALATVLLTARAEQIPRHIEPTG